ncbi:MAG: CheR family methyltransferase [Xenococcaceae cyanobacterium MO_234.B1]|nr:CheR family methyltransferase [Xenococcaceae cyanobacterium MO_234.B1]
MRNSLAMLFAEELGLEQFRQRIKIYATDVDQEALNQARQASYNAKEMKTVLPELQERYFEMTGRQYLFRPDLRRTVIFGCHDLVQDAPISRLDLLVCRNTLMYAY